MTLVENLRIATAAVMTLLGVITTLSLSFCLWLLAAAVLSKLFPRKIRLPDAPVTRFCIVIPAHDEELVIARTLSDLCNIEYPQELFNVALIADNCTDRTAQIAERFPSVDVLKRENPDRRGKGYDKFDTFIVVDADTSVEPTFLRAMDSRRQQNAGKPFAAQGRYDVQNPDDSWRTALMAGALSLVHVVRPMARERLGLTTGLKGNGMAFDRSVLLAVQWAGDSLTEDIEYTLDLLEKLNITVAFVPEAKVAALMPSTAKGAESQRRRWENGRNSLLKRRAFSLLVKGLLRLNPLYIDAAIDLLSPPIAEMAALLAAWILTIGIFGAEGGDWRLAAIFAGAAVFGLALYVLGGFAAAGAPALAYRALLYAPFYMIWKIVLRLTPRSSSEWVRTDREQQPVDVDLSLISETNVKTADRTSH